MTSLAGRPAPFAAIRVIAADIKLAHSVFALPFALLAAFMAAMPAGPPPRAARAFAAQLLLVMAAMVLARTVAMLANRLLDRAIDARNPRTAGRAIPSGRLPPGQAAAAMAGCAAAFLAIAALFGVLFGNWYPALLGPPVLAWLCAYPLLKRFTMLCHLYLGSCLAISPLAAAVAIEPALVVPASGLAQPSLWLLAAMVLCWVAGFDVIYALQDVEVDRAQALHSIPARLGIRRGLWIARLLHTVAASCLIAIVFADARLRVLFAGGVAVVIVLLIVEHVTVARRGTTRIALAFFTLNGIIACLLGGLGILDVVV
jgi:4-hydroxybenzoate polyprenyltransferase